MLKYVFCTFNLISKDGGCSKYDKNGITKAQGVFSRLKKIWKNRESSLRAMIIMLEATVMTVAKYRFEAWGLRKEEEGCAQSFPEKSPADFLGTRLTDHISNSKLYEECDLTLLSRVVMRESMKWPKRVQRRKNNRLPKIFLSTNRLGPNENQVVS